MARSTILTTTHRRIRSLIEPSLNKIYCTSDRMLRYNRIIRNIFMGMFFVAKDHGPSRWEFTCVQLFVTDFGFVKVKFMKLKSALPLALNSLFKNTGVPEKNICNRDPNQIKGKSMKLCNECDCKIQQLERCTLWSNCDEGHIGITKIWVENDFKLSNCPMVLWCYATEKRSNIMSISTRNIYDFRYQVLSSKLTGQKTIIYFLAVFDWYKRVYYRDPGKSFPSPFERIVRCLGHAYHVGTAASQCVLKNYDNVCHTYLFITWLWLIFRVKWSGIN